MRQAAALPCRFGIGTDRLEALLVTSGAERWIVPKGDVDDGIEPHRAAEKEAFEEGGVRGRIGNRSIGAFCSCKDQDGASIPVEIEVFPLEVTDELDRWPEMKQRQRRWLPLGGAADAVDEPDLAAIIRKFLP